MRSGLVALAIALTAQALGACAAQRYPGQREVEAFEQVLRQLPDVADADVDFDEKGTTYPSSLRVAVDLRPGTAADRAAAVVHVVADRRKTAPFTELDVPRLEMSVGRGRAFAEYVMGGPAEESAIRLLLDLPAEDLEAGTRLWFELRESFDQTGVAVDPGRLEVRLGPSAPGAVVRAHQVLARNARATGDSRMWRTLKVDTQSYNSSPDLPPEPVVQAMQALADVAAPPGEGSVEVRWFRDAETPAGCLWVHANVFEKVAAAYRERLEASGLPFSLKVFVHNPADGRQVVETDRCGAG